MKTCGSILKDWLLRCSAAVVAASVFAALAPAAVLLRDVTKQTGITFVHTDGSSGKRYIVETVCAGLALFDYDNDGDVDIYFLNGAPLPGRTRSGPSGRGVDRPPRNALYRNDGGWKFTDVTEQAGVGDTGYGLGVAVGDYDNDGHQDLYLNNFGPNVLYHNNGNGTFTDVTKQAAVGVGEHVGAGACFLDIDKDGDLDLFVAHYVAFTFENHQIARFNGYPAYVGPLNYPTTANTLFRNNGDGTFTDISGASGIAAHKGAGMGMVCADYDNDRDTDIIVGNDEAGNFVFRNDGTGKFEEVGLLSGLAYDSSGVPQGTMGVDCGDYNNDGLLDFHMTSYERELATLYKNLGGGAFQDVTKITGAGEGTLPYVTWGNGLVDLDNDGDRDILIACGHLHDNVELFDNVTSYLCKNIVLENLGREKFANISEQCGDGLQIKLSSRGAGFDDLDNDGDLDVVILNSRREPTILRNDLPKPNHWIGIRLRGVKSNRDGVGAHVKVAAGDLTQLAEVHSGRSYQSHFGTRLHFGLGPRDRIDRIEVHWLGGGTEAIENIPADRLVTITEGQPQLVAAPPASR